MSTQEGKIAQQSTYDKFARNLDSETIPSLDALRSSIPEALFKPSTMLSIFYYVKDMTIISGLYFLLYYYNQIFEQYYILYPIIWFVLGTYFWALFVVGHDCGHRSFSNSLLICDIFGHLSHSLILVPFHPWRLSHAHHHRHTGDVDQDESFVALTESRYRELLFYSKFIRYYSYWFCGYIVYLIFGMPNTVHSHFLPVSDTFYPTFKAKLESGFSVLCVLLVASMLGRFAYFYGFIWLCKVYLIPYLVFNAWIAIVTHLHHTHPDVPWYRGEEWNFVKGALSTVDRNYGLVEDIHHNIGTHVVHHLFSRIPHYNLKEANSHLAPVLGDHYRKTTEPTLSAMYTAFLHCRFVPEIGNVLYHVPDWREVITKPQKADQSNA